MGSAMAQNLPLEGHEVTGVQVLTVCLAELEARGGHGVASTREVARVIEVVITLLNNVNVFHAITSGEDGMIHELRPVAVVVDTCMRAVVDKARTAGAFQARGIPLLYCAVSGNCNSILDESLALYASGDEAAYKRVLPVLETISGSQTFLGAFGTPASSSSFSIIWRRSTTRPTAAAALAA